MGAMVLRFGDRHFVHFGRLQLFPGKETLNKFYPTQIKTSYPHTYKLKKQKPRVHCRGSSKQHLF